MSGIVDSLLPAIDSILGVRDAVGAIKDTVSFVVRTWSGTQPGEGTPVDVVTQMLPTPGIKDYSQSIRLREGGAVKNTDIILYDISGNLYHETDLDGTTASANIEKFFLVGSKLYNVIDVVKNYVTWNVQLRELTNQTRY